MAGDAGLSVVIATKDRRADLLACLRSLARQTRPPGEIIIVDATGAPQGDEAATYQAAAGAARVRYARARRPGAASQRNQALDMLGRETRHVLLLDDDVVLEPDYCAVLIGALEADPQLVAVNGWIVNPSAAPFEPRLRWLLRLFLIYGQKPGHILPSGFNTPLWVGAPGAPFVTETLEGGNACIRADALRGLRFDPAYERFSGYAYAEDIDLTYALGRGKRMIVEPRARMTHNTAQAGRTNDVRLGLAQAVNRARLVQKHLGRDPYHLACYLWAMIGVVLLNAAMVARGRSPLRLAGNIAGIGIALAEWPSGRGSA